ncbi:MAG: class I SAM-dependent methyltransferase [Chloroflexota bacterium]
MIYKVLLHYLSFTAVEVETSSVEEALETARRNVQTEPSSAEIMSNLGRFPDYDRTRPVLESKDNHYDFIMSRLLKPGIEGDWELRLDTVPAGRSVGLYDRSGRITIGEYAFDYPIVVLSERGRTWMTDSQLETESCLGAVELARGDCLVSGLGIGLLPTLIKHRVDSIDIVEVNSELTRLIYPQIKTEKTRIINDDIFHYLETTDKKYDFIHIDIWGDITAPLLEIEKVREKARRCLKPGGVVWCWLQELYDRIKNSLPKEPVHPGKTGVYAPCLICGNRLRSDYGGLCAVCAEAMGVSERYKK